MTEKWQPIKTAPKDGKEVLGCHVAEWGDWVVGPWTMVWDDYENEWTPSWENEPVRELTLCGPPVNKSLDLQPNYWMPLPEPQRSEIYGQ